MADKEETPQARLIRQRDEQRQKERSNKLKNLKYLENIIDRKNVEIYNIYIQLKMNIRIARELYKLKPEHIDSDSLQVSIYYKEKEYFYEEGTFDKYRESIKLLKGINFDETVVKVEDTDSELETNRRKKLTLPEYIYNNRDDNRGKPKYTFDENGHTSDNRGKPGFIEEGINLMKHAPRSEEGISLYDVLCEDLAYTLDEDYKNDEQNSYLKSLQKIAEEEEEERKKDEEFLGEEFLVLGKEFLGVSDRILFMDLLDKQRKLFDEEKKELTDIELVEDLKNKFRIVETLRSKKVIDITTLPLASRILRAVTNERDDSYLENPGSKDIELYNNLVYSTDLLSTELYNPYFFFDKKIYFFLVLLEPDSTKKKPYSTKYSSHINNIIKKFTKNEEGTVIEDDDGLVRKYKANKISINKSIQYLIDNAPKSREGISLYDAINKTGEAGEAGAAANKARLASLFISSDSLNFFSS